MGSEIFFPLAQFWYIRPQECVLLFQTGINVILQIPLVMVDTVILCMSWFWPTKTCIDKINNNRIDSKYLWWRSDRLDGAVLFIVWFKKTDTYLLFARQMYIHFFESDVRSTRWLFQIGEKTQLYGKLNATQKNYQPYTQFIKCPTSRNLRFCFDKKPIAGLCFNDSDSGAGWLNKFFNSQSQRDNIPRTY